MSVVANVAINVDSSGAVSKLRQVQTQAQATEKAFGALQSAIGALGVGFALTKVIADVKELDTNLRRLGTVGVDVGKISPALSKLSDELGGVASKAELAAASYQAASAGFSDTAGNVNILRAATKAATGGLADTQAVTEVLVKTLNSYGMSGNQAIQVTDSISKAVELGNQEWSDYTSQLGRVASIAALAGVSLDEVNAFIASATKNGATAEIAFTGLGATLNTLLQPTKESQEAAAKLGIAWNYGGLQAKGFTGLMAELAVAMEKDKEASARLLGSQEAMRGAFAAASKNGSDFKNILEQIGGAAGKTDADFQTMKGSLENTLKALDTSFKNLSEALGVAFGPTVVKTITDTAAAINIVADALNAVPQPLKSATGEAAKFVIQMLLVQKAIQAIIALRAAFIGAMAGMAGATVASGAAATTSAGAFALYTNNARALQATSVAATASVGGLAGALMGLAAIGIITVGINYVITQTGAILGSSTAAGKSEAAGTAGGLAAQLKGKSAAERKQMLAAAQKNLANDKKLASTLSLQIKAQESAMTMPGEGPLPSDRSKLTEIQARINTNQARIKAIQATPIERAVVTGNAMGTPIGATVGGASTGKDGGASKAASEAKRAADEAKRAAEQMQQQLKAADDINFALKNRLAIAQTTEPVAKRMLEYDIKQNEIAKEYDELKKAAKGADELALINANLIIEQRIAQIEYEQEINGLLAERAILMADIVRQASMPTVYNELETQEAALQAVLDKYPAIGAAADAAATMATSGIAAIIAGTQSAEQVFVEFLSSIADALINTAKQMIAQYIAIGIAKMFAGLGSSGGGFAPSGELAAVGNVGTGFNFDAGAMLPAFRANGGPVTSQQPYIVGERGPELFVPGTGGSVVNSNDLRSAMGAAPGSGSGSPVLNMSFQSTTINGTEYVSRDQLEQAMAQTRRQASRDGAQRGMTMTLDKLQQSPSTRSRVGMR